jgi:putative restriction endonuclease
LDFDPPVFKQLAHNDTGQAKGHQGGVVIPKSLAPYFPLLERRITPQNPTVDITISADLFSSTRFLGRASTRYQYQTWGGTRTPERRLTDNLTPLRNIASADDILLFERSVQDSSHYRLTLIKVGTPEHAAIKSRSGNDRWGPVDPSNAPVSEIEIEKAGEELKIQESKVFQLFDDATKMQERKTFQLARSRAFSRQISQIYNSKCAVCSNGFRTTKGLYETEAAHIVSKKLRGSDDARNGISLCKSHHWAFDKGLFGVANDFRIIVPPHVIVLPGNASLELLSGRKILLPSIEALYPAATALEWHRNNLLEKLGD